MSLLHMMLQTNALLTATSLAHEPPPPPSQTNTAGSFPDFLRVVSPTTAGIRVGIQTAIGQFDNLPCICRVPSRCPVKQGLGSRQLNGSDLPLDARFRCFKASHSTCHASSRNLLFSARAFSAAEKCSAGVMRCMNPRYFLQSSSCSSSLFSSLLMTAACVFSLLISNTCVFQMC